MDQSAAAINASADYISEDFLSVLEVSRKCETDGRNTGKYVRKRGNSRKQMLLARG